MAKKISELTTHRRAGATLLEGVRQVCADLAKFGWGELFQAHGLNIEAKDLAAELLRPLPGINRDLDGFQDFSLEGTRGIEPCKPSQSLLFHALASPQVTTDPSGKALRKFPSLAQTELVENYVFGVCPPSIHELRARANEAPIALVVFAAQYRPAIHTVHQRHADMCFSRVGLARVGTASPKYVPAARGFVPEADTPFDIRVLPCKFSAYIAVQCKGDKQSFGPTRFQESRQTTREVGEKTIVTAQKGDEQRNFWVPVHKVFDGPECIRGMSLQLAFAAPHVNEKLRRVHRALGAEGIDTGSHAPDLDSPPFKFTEGIGQLSAAIEDGTGLFVPTPHSALVEPAKKDGKTLTYKVPVNRPPFRSSLIIPSRKSGARSAPEYVHARHALRETGIVEDLNNLAKVAKEVEKGGYNAVHYVDYTADGYVSVECPELATEIPRNLSAYSLVAAVDFFPLVRQQELMQWWVQSVPPDLIDSIWPENPGPPLTLSDIRYPANQSLTFDKLDVSNEKRAVFDIGDDTMTAIVASLDAGRGRQTRIDPAKNFRVSWLPDSAAGVFAPGWDVSVDRTEESDPSDNGSILLPGVTNLNNYGLGSPFPEDAMLCAALSSFWPAAAPDITRTFAPGRYATTTPLTDNVLGMVTPGPDPWDGIHGPRIPDPANKMVEFRAIEYGDYVQAALNKKFNFTSIGGITTEEYGARTLSMARVYQTLGATKRDQKIKWVVFSFLKSSPDDAERIKIERAAGVRLNKDFSYWFKLFEHKGAIQSPTDHRSKLVAYDRIVPFLADSQTVLRQEEDGTWQVFRY